MARVFFALCALTLFASVVAVRPIEDIDDNEDVDIDVEFDLSELQDENQRGWQSFLKGVAKGLALYAGEEFVRRINKECFYELPGKCGWNILKGKFYKCAYAHFKDNKDRCLTLKH